MSETKPIKHFSPGVCQRADYLLPMMTVYFEDDMVVMYVADDFFRYDSVEAMVVMWEAKAADIRISGTDMHAAALDVMQAFQMKPDDCE